MASHCFNDRHGQHTIEILKLLHFYYAFGVFQRFFYIPNSDFIIFKKIPGKTLYWKQYSFCNSFVSQPKIARATFLVLGKHNWNFMGFDISFWVLCALNALTKWNSVIQNATLIQLGFNIDVQSSSPQF